MRSVRLCKADTMIADVCPAEKPVTRPPGILNRCMNNENAFGFYQATLENTDTSTQDRSTTWP